MLTVQTVDEVKGAPKTGLDGNDVLLNTELMNNLITVDTTKTRMLYNYRVNDRRTFKIQLKVDETVANMRTEIDLDYANPTQTKTIALDIYPDNNTAKATVSRVFQYKDIIWALDEANGTDCLIDVALGGAEVKRYLANTTISAIETAAKTT